MNLVCERGDCWSMADFLFTWPDGSQTLDCGWHVMSATVRVERLRRIDPRINVHVDMPKKSQ
jgi:hypothetical protein